MRRYPDLSIISSQQLSDILANPDTIQPILLDTRTPEEYAVSHLQNARLAETEEGALEVLKDADKNQFIVVYCSVGYRSSYMEDILKKHGFTNVRCLEGSIFKWANEGKPVFNGDKQVKLVHPYDKEWGVLLKKELWSLTPQK